MRYSALIVCTLSFILTACSTYSPTQTASEPIKKPTPQPVDVSSRLPQQIATKEKVIVVDPRVHAWGAYGADGNLIKSGLASAGSDYCADLGRRCHTSTGTFRINSLGSPNCKSSLYPKPRGGAPMPYCMFFNGNQALHGSPSSHVVDANVSHGCVRMYIPDAEWVRYNFATVGTKVIVRPYQ
jgi:hypothetical protein